MDIGGRCRVETSNLFFQDNLTMDEFGKCKMSSKMMEKYNPVCCLTHFKKAPHHFSISGSFVNEFVPLPNNIAGVCVYHLPICTHINRINPA